METKLIRIAEIAKEKPKDVFTSRNFGAWHHRLELFNVEISMVTGTDFVH